MRLAAKGLVEDRRIEQILGGHVDADRLDRGDIGGDAVLAHPFLF